MPIYEYACRECGHAFDALQKISDDPLRDCPECGRPELKKLVSAPNFRLKGSGWYETDFKKDKQRNLAGDGVKPDAGKKDDGGKSKPDSGGDKASAGKADSSAKKSAPQSE